MQLFSNFAAKAVVRNNAYCGNKKLEIATDVISPILDSLGKSCLKLFVGGSIAKGSCDPRSDADVTIVVNSKNKSFKKDHLESANHFNDDLADGGIWRLKAGLEVDLHVFSERRLDSLISDFCKGKAVSLSVQDLMWNIRHGIYLLGEGGCHKSSLDSAYLNKKSPSYLAVENKLSFLLTALQNNKPDNHEADLTCLEFRVKCIKFLLLLTYHKLGEGFWGFKKTNLIIDSIPNGYLQTIESFLSPEKDLFKNQFDDLVSNLFIESNNVL